MYSLCVFSCFINNLFLKILLIHFFYFRGEEKEKERERNINVWVPLVCPIVGTQPTIQACAPTRN